MMTKALDTHPKLGAYVRDSGGRLGRVTGIEHGCAQGDDWLAQQTLLTEAERTADGPWLDILVHGGGAIHVPAAVVEVVEPFDFENSWSSFYFEET